MFVSDEFFKIFKYIYRGGGANGPSRAMPLPRIYIFFSYNEK
jgi:hypothetical protein